MNISELIEDLERVQGDIGDVEVRMAFQPSWPLAFRVAGVVTDGEAHENGADPDRYDAFDSDFDGKPIVWLVEGGHPSDSPYAPRGCWS